MGPFRRRSDQASARNIAAYQMASAPLIIRTYDHVEAFRAGLGGRHPWRTSEYERLRLLMTWVVQTCLVAGDRVFSRARQGSDQDQWLPVEVERWLARLYRLGHDLVPRMEQLMSSDNYVLDKHLPIGLPGPAAQRPTLTRQPVVAPPVGVESTQAVIDLVEALAAQVDLAWGQVESHGAPPRELRPWAERIRQRHLGLATVVNQQRDLWLGRPEGALRREVYDRSWSLARDLFWLGQQMIVPRLFDPTFTLRADRVHPTRAAHRGGAAPGGAGERTLAMLRRWLGFDPWALTAPERRSSTREALNQLDAFWRADPDPRATWRIQRQLDEALEAGRIERRGDETLRECPWTPVYVALTTINVGERIGGGTIFVFNPGLVAGVFTHRLTRLGTVPGSRRPRKPSTPAAPAAGAAARPAIGPAVNGPAAPPAKGTAGGQRVAGDLWLLTDPQVAAARADDPGARQQLTRLWSAEDNPELTRSLLARVLEAESTGMIRRRPTRMAWRDCPWPSTFVAVAPVSVGGERIAPGEVFALTAEVCPTGFARRLVRVGRYPARD